MSSILTAGSTEHSPCHLNLQVKVEIGKAACTMLLQPLVYFYYLQEEKGMSSHTLVLVPTLTLTWCKLLMRGMRSVTLGTSGSSLFSSYRHCFAISLTLYGSPGREASCPSSSKIWMSTPFTLNLRQPRTEDLQ